LSHGPSATETRHLRTLFAVGAAGMLSDGQLLERFATRDGDPAELAFAALVERHGSMVLRVARGVSLDEHAAHDAFQATFLILARKARSLWVRDSLGPWLHSVAFRVASHSRSMELRRKRREKDAAKPEADHSQIADRADLIRAIHEEIDRLPQPFRLAVVTCHLEGLTQHDAAERLGWPVGTLQSRLARGRQKLRDRLERRGLSPSLAVLAGHLPPVPHLLTTTTARAAASLNLGQAITGMIPSTVQAMIETTTKGMFMTKLKLGVAAVVMMVGGIVGSGMAVGVGRPVQATDELKPTAQLVATSPSESADKDDPEDIIPPPADGPGFPYLLEFYHSEFSKEGRKAHQEEVARLTRQGYPIKSVDTAVFASGKSPGRALSDHYEVHGYPTVLLVDGAGDEIARFDRIGTPAEIAAFFNENRSRLPKRARPIESGSTDNRTKPPVEPGFTIPSNPKPWATVARIKIKLSEKEWGFGSGTVISNRDQASIIPTRDQASIILTCAHTFRLKGQPQPAPKDFQVPIAVDLFDGRLGGDTPATVSRAEQDLVGQVIDYDFDNDVGLIRIRPGRKLPVSRVVPDTWRPRKGMKMTTVGCSHGADATAWETTILDPRVTMSNTETKQTFFEIKCTNQPKEGRTGGGLYTSDGFVAGVCNFADPNEHVGLYAVPEAIHRLLDRNGLSWLYAKGDGNARTEDVDIHGFKYPAPADMLAAAGHLPKQATEPSLTDRSLPKPWETSVRVKVQHSGTELGFGAGTIIQSTETSAIIMTSARILRRRPGEAIPLLKDYRSSIEINLYDDQHAPVIGRPPIDIHADLIDYDLSTDLCLLRIQTDRRLPASPVVLPNRPFSPRMIALGGLWGKDSTVWNTGFLELVALKQERDGLSVNAFKCPDRPDASRNGSGLYTLDGYLTGVCTRPDLDESAAGYYIVPGDIHRFLDRNGMTSFYLPGFGTASRPSTEATPADFPLPKTAQPKPASDDKRRIDELEKKLDQVLKALEGLKGEKKPE
jgi:RNA polymerase sigma factor (sigma-70 family)